jgi:hypothetical protein
MIVVENSLKDLFAQLPTINGFKPKFNWGSQDTLNLYLSQLKTTNKYPLIWLVETPENGNFATQAVEKSLKLIIAKQSVHVTNTNPIIWDTEFKDVLNPLLENVLKALDRSTITEIKDSKYKIQRISNYSEDNGKNAKTIDNWNVIVLEVDVYFKDNCLKLIKF